jgi:glycosyltransferase involved in cell wall biosynthesis
MLPPLEQHDWETNRDSVSVVIPSYNHAKYIGRTLSSIYAQTLKPQRLLIIDDGSTDNSIEIIEGLLDDAPFPAELIARENRGLSATLTEAKRHLADESLRLETSFFAYLGSDDAWRPDFLEKRVALLNSRPGAVLAYGNAYSIDADDRVIDCSIEWANYTDGDARSMLLDGIAPMSPTVLYRSAAIRDLTWNENSRLEDYDFYLRLSTRGEFAYAPSILSAWRQHGVNISESSLMMMEEKISALYRNAPLFDLSNAELNRLVRLARFRGAQELMRRGQKSLAAKHGLPNLSASRSWIDACRFIGGLVAPSSALHNRRDRSREAASRRYGEFQV